MRGRHHRPTRVRQQKRSARTVALQQLAAESLKSSYGNMPREVMTQATVAGVTNTEWLYERLLQQAGLSELEPVTFEVTVSRTPKRGAAARGRAPRRRGGRRRGAPRKKNPEMRLFRLAHFVSSAALLGRLAFEHVRSAFGH
jgi:hypothetical protein